MQDLTLDVTDVTRLDYLSAHGARADLRSESTRWTPWSPMFTYDTL